MNVQDTANLSFFCMSRVIISKQPSNVERYPCIDEISSAEVAEQRPLQYLGILRMSLDMEPWRPLRCG